MNENISLNSENKTGVSGEYNYPKMNFIQRVFGVIFSPGKVMQDLEQKPRILFALLLTLLTPVVMILSVFPMYLEFTRSTLEATFAKMNTQMTAEMTAKQIDQALNIAKITGPIGGAVAAAAMWFLGALVLWTIIKILKGEGRYKQILSVTGYSAVIAALSAIVTIITTQLIGTFSEVSLTSLASFLPNMKGSFLYGAAKTIDVFSIWQYIVIAIGAATVSKLDKKKVYIIVACIFAVLMIYTGAMEVRVAGVI